MSALRSALNRTARRLRAAAGGSAVILTYHRVLETELDPHLLAIPPARFAEHVAAFSARYTLVSVGDVLRALATGRRLPRRALAISFDDGYADSLEFAAPILQDAGAPATVFVSTRGIAGTAEFWWDELEQLVLLGPLPERLVLPGVDGRELTVAVPDDERPAASPASFAGWDVTQAADTVRRRLYEGLSDHLRDQQPAIRDRVLASLREQTGVTPVVRDGKRVLDEAGVRGLARFGVEVGAHTVDHVWLAALPVEEQREQIAGSKRTLEGLTGGEVVSFSYPYGGPDSFTDETEDLVRDAGFLGAVTTGLGTPPWGSAGLGSDRFALSRMPTANVPASELIPLIDKRLGL